MPNRFGKQPNRTKDNLRISKTGNSVKLHAKYNNKWYSTSLKDSFNITNSHKRPSNDGLITLQGENDGIALNNITAVDSGKNVYMKLQSSENYRDYFKLSTYTNGATTLQTFDKIGGAADMTLSIDGKLYIRPTADAAQQVTFMNGSNISGLYEAEDGSHTRLKMYENGGESDDDFFKIEVGEHGATTLGTTDDGGAQGHITLDADGDVSLDAAEGGADNGIFLKQAGAKIGLISGHHLATWLRLYENVGTTQNDYFDIKVEASGVTTLSTKDDAGSDADLTLNADGDITLDSETGVFIAKKAGTEFSAANSAYAGMILGYTCLRGDGTNMSSFEIQNSLTVEDASHKVTFKTPPSEKVEIEAIFLVNASSTDTRIAVGLSDNSTYNSVGITHEYDGNAVWFTDDEVDDSLITVKFVLTSTELASIGSDNTFWIGISTDAVTKTAYLSYGVRSAFGIGEHPFIIKATALPATIYDGT